MAPTGSHKRLTGFPENHLTKFSHITKTNNINSNATPDIAQHTRQGRDHIRNGRAKNKQPVLKAACKIVKHAACTCNLHTKSTCHHCRGWRVCSECSQRACLSPRASATILVYCLCTACVLLVYCLCTACVLLTNGAWPQLPPSVCHWLVRFKLLKLLTCPWDRHMTQHTISSVLPAGSSG